MENVAVKTARMK